MRASWSFTGGIQGGMEVSFGATMSPDEAESAMRMILEGFRDDLVRAVYAQVVGGRISDENRN